MSCPWNNKGRVFSCRCPILWHTLYPYFLGLVFGAKYSESGECKVACPGNVDTIVLMEKNDGSFPDYIPADWRDVIYAEVVAVRGSCDECYCSGERIYFPTFDKSGYKCPAAIYNMFPLKGILIPKCLNMKKLHCPDWAENVYYSLED
jgi:hypothetical protein